MTDPLDNIQKRLGWINRGLVLGAALIVVALIVFAVHRMRGASAPPAPGASAASAPLHPASGASAPKAAASTATRAASAPAAASSSTPPRAASGTAPAAASAASGASPGAASAQPAQAAASGAAPALPQVQPTAPPPSASAAAAPARRVPSAHARAARRHPVARHEPSRKHVAAASAVCSRAGWYVQVGAFAEVSSYEALSARLQHFGLPHCRGARSPHGLHVLLVGPYATREQALRLRSHLKEPLRKASYLRHLGSK